MRLFKTIKAPFFLLSFRRVFSGIDFLNSVLLMKRQMFSMNKECKWTKNALFFRSLNSLIELGMNLIIFFLFSWSVLIRYDMINVYL